MIKRNLRLWLSIIGGVLIIVFAYQTHFYLSYVLRVPGYLLNQYIPISIIVHIRYGAFSLSAFEVAFYALSIYGIIWLLSLTGNWKYQPTPSS